MKLGRRESGEEIEIGPERLGGDGWRRRIASREGGSRLLKLVMLVIVLVAAAWALYANLRPDRPAMDMNMRVTSGATPFPVVVVPVERGPIMGTVVYTGSVAPFNEETSTRGSPGGSWRCPCIPAMPCDPGRCWRVSTASSSPRGSGKPRRP